MDDLVFRLRKRAEIRQQINTRKSVQQGEPDRIVQLLLEAAAALEVLWEDGEENLYAVTVGDNWHGG